MPQGTRMVAVVFVLVVITMVSFSGLGAYYLKLVDPPNTPGRVSPVVISHENMFVGAASDNVSLYVGLLNGTVEKMNPRTGLVETTVTLPDRNAGAHLLFFNGSLYVGTEWLRGAADTAPFHIYRINPETMQIVGQLPMNSPKANGFVFVFNGYLWAGDGACTLYEIKPETLSVNGTVPGVAEDEMVYDGTYYWTECKATVNVLQPGHGLPTVVATGTIPPPGRPRGFFANGSGVYTSNNRNFALYRLEVSGSEILFENVGTLGAHSLQTRDTFVHGGLLYAYETRDDARIPGRVFIYDANLNLKAVVPLPGYALPTDASQHTLFLLSGLVYFVTESYIGYFLPLDGRTV